MMADARERVPRSRLVSLNPSRLANLADKREENCHLAFADECECANAVPLGTQLLRLNAKDLNLRSEKRSPQRA